MTRPAAFAFPGATPELLASTLSARGSSSRKPLRELSLDDFDLVEDTDGQLLRLCQECRLPVGDVAYSGGCVDVANGEQAAMHGECTAKRMLRQWTKEEQQRKVADNQKKSARRAEYGIGWKVENIPRNMEHAAQLGCSPAPEGMCCLVLDDGALCIDATLEPAVSVSLEYLSLALKVRLCEGKEPYFSLDPVLSDEGAEAPLVAMQTKRFSPDWLAGTSVGEVLFQADYHLKELSMGEYAQPVVGMKSCFDFSEDAWHEQWTARVWFVVNGAEVQLSEDNALMPIVKMGIEAREQVLNPEAPDGVEDAPITRRDHPLVRYAEEFTHHFDLIAERRSVFFQLRELAKASILAKYISESGVTLEDPWLNLKEPQGTACCLEIPQLWNERRRTQIQVRDGAIVDQEQEGQEATKHLVYGGVHFGLDRLDVFARSTMTPSGQVVLSSSVATLPMAPSARTLRPISMSLSMRRSPFMGSGPPGPQTMMEAPVWTEPAAPPGSVKPVMYGMEFKHSLQSPDNVWHDIKNARFSGVSDPPSGRGGAPRAAATPAGVDLNLDGFDLSSATRVERRAAAAATSAAVARSFGQAWRATSSPFSRRRTTACSRTSSIPSCRTAAPRGTALYLLTPVSPTCSTCAAS
jgi:hypothetical protein